ncbi:hypothetical protein AOA12_20185 [Microbacterium sp. No. 7]|nr:hypothetical protein AOA12_20185 [Microbacterium sp. No. 7]
MLGRDASCSPLTEAHSGDKLDTFIQYCVTRWEREKPFRKRLLSEITMRIGETLHEHRKATGRAS